MMCLSWVSELWRRNYISCTKILQQVPVMCKYRCKCGLFVDVPLCCVTCRVVSPSYNVPIRVVLLRLEAYLHSAMNAWPFTDRFRKLRLHVQNSGQFTKENLHGLCSIVLFHIKTIVIHVSFSIAWRTYLAIWSFIPHLPLPWVLDKLSFLQHFLTSLKWCTHCKSLRSWPLQRPPNRLW